MFGAWGNTDVDACVRIVHRALDAGITFVDTADVYSAGGSEEIVGTALKGRPPGRRPRLEGPRPDGPGPERTRQLPAVDHARDRRLAPAARHRPPRPVPDPPTRGCNRHRGDARRAHGPPASGQDPVLRLVHLSGVADRGGAVDGRTARAVAFPHRKPRYSIFVRHIEPTCSPWRRTLGMGVLVWSPLARGWLTGRYRRETSTIRPTRGPRAGRTEGRTSPRSSTSRHPRSNGSWTSSRRTRRSRRTPAFPWRTSRWPSCSPTRA